MILLFLDFRRSAEAAASFVSATLHPRPSFPPRGNGMERMVLGLTVIILIRVTLGLVVPSVTFVGGMGIFRLLGMLAALASAAFPNVLLTAEKLLLEERALVSDLDERLWRELDGRARTSSVSWIGENSRIFKITDALAFACSIRACDDRHVQTELRYVARLNQWHRKFRFEKA